MTTGQLPASDALPAELAALIAERVLAVQPGFGPDSDLWEAGLDSMALMQLLIAVEERFGVALSESTLTRENTSTARQLAALLRERTPQP